MAHPPAATRNSDSLPTVDLEAEIEYEHEIRHELQAAAKAPSPEQAVLAAKAAKWQPEWYYVFENWRDANKDEPQPAPPAAAPHHPQQHAETDGYDSDYAFEDGTKPPTADEHEQLMKRAPAQTEKKTAEKTGKKTVKKQSWMGRKCKLCKKPLVAIGHRRANGMDGQKDWLARRYHKSCYKLKMEEPLP